MENCSLILTKLINSYICIIYLIGTSLLYFAKLYGHIPSLNMP